MGAQPTRKGLGEGALLVSTCDGEVNFSFTRCRGNAGGGDEWAEKRGARSKETSSGTTAPLEHAILSPPTPPPAATLKHISLTELPPELGNPVPPRCLKAKNSP